MVLRLSRKLGVPRRIAVGYGVAFSFRAFGFAELKEIEAAALRLAREQLDPRHALELAASDDEDLAPESEDALRGRVADRMLQLLVLRHATGWEGVEEEDGSPAPLNATTLGLFLGLFPGVGQVLLQEVTNPLRVMEAEGNASAPSPDTATAVG